MIEGMGELNLNIIVDYEIQQNHPMEGLGGRWPTIIRGLAHHQAQPDQTMEQSDTAGGSLSIVSLW